VQTKRLVALILGAALVIVLAAFAISGDLGDPSVPDGDVALVQDAPDSDITTDQYQTALEQAAFNLNLKQPPPESDPQFAQVRQSALSNLIQTRWVEGEAEERGITVTDRDIQQQLDQIIQQQLGGKKGYEKFIKTSPFDADAVREVARLSVLSQRIQTEALPKSPPSVSDSEIQDYYDANIAQFTSPAQRDVREILNKDQAAVEQAKAALEQDDSATAWKKVAAKYSTDDATKGQGGLRQGVVAGQSEQVLDDQIFSAPVGQLVGPFKGQAGYYLIEVEKATPEQVQPLDDQLKQQITQQLQQGIQSQDTTAFRENFISKWQSRTFCADDYITDLCANAAPAPDTCPIDDPSERDQADPATLAAGCEAPVLSRPVVDPGTGSVFPGQQAPVKPQGVQTGASPAQPTTPGVPIGPGGAPAPGTTAPPTQSAPPPAPGG
jgi:parvulin-like peptidyl-prolyl isomerase